MPFLMRRYAPQLMALFLAVTPLLAHAEDEAAVRAAMIFNLLKFTMWPSTLSANAPLHICLIDASPELSAAIQTLHARRIDSHELNVSLEQKPNTAGACEVVVTDAANNGFDPAKLARHGLLTIGNTQFIDRGGMIGVVRVDNKIRFEINATEMQREGIALSSKALQLALRVR